jgi:hypothetical protein
MHVLIVDDHPILHETLGAVARAAILGAEIREFSRALKSVFAVFLISVSACAQSPAPLAPGSTDAKTALRPYLGTWRPTSFAEELKSGPLTISVDGLSLEMGPLLTYDVAEATDEGVILRVTSRKPANAFRTAAPTGMTWTRESLRICYWSGSLDRLVALGIKKAPCGNTYIR